MAKIISHFTKIELLKCFRQLHISVPHNTQAKMMKKVMGSNIKKKSKFYEAPTLLAPKSFSKGAFEGKRSVNSKRATVLNKLFMRYITDLMSSGECSSAFIGHGIEIDHVQITPDFSCVKVFWISKSPEKDEIIEDILHKNTGQLRHELAQLKVVGVIPKIRFVKDKHYAQAIKVDNLLTKADFGDDYIPEDITTKLKTELELNTSLEPHIVQKLSKLDNSEDVYEDPLPPMPNNVFGLNHSEIMERIQKSKQKSRALHRYQSEDAEEVTPRFTNENPIQFTSAHEEKEAFREFLRQRQILKNKASRLDKNYKPEFEYLQEEWLRKQETLIENSQFKNNNMDDEDFIDEDDNTN
ncbi:hypothetical protein ILUMI_10976, partial [Ignelater luminosus]